MNEAFYQSKREEGWSPSLGRKLHPEPRVVAAEKAGGMGDLTLIKGGGNPEPRASRLSLTSRQ